MGLYKLTRIYYPQTGLEHLEIHVGLKGIHEGFGLDLALNGILGRLCYAK